MRIDAAVYLGEWPFRELTGTMRSLIGMMQESALDEALVSPIGGFFANDPGAANDRLLRGIRARPNLLAAPCVNPLMADSARRVEHMAMDPQVRAVRLCPGFHGYRVAEAETVVCAAAERGITSVVQLRMQDERSHLPAFRVPAAPLNEVADLAGRLPRARFVLAAARIAEVIGLAQRIRALPNMWLDTSHLDGLDCLRRACDAVGAEKLLFASSWPFFYARSALLKAEESRLEAGERQMLMGTNAVKVFSRAS